jgi:hypothetical protein
LPPWVSPPLAGAAAVLTIARLSVVFHVLASPRRTTPMVVVSGEYATQLRETHGGQLPG